MLRDRRIPNLEAVLKELKSVNERFLRIFAEMPPTFCVVNLRKTPLVDHSETECPCT